MIIQECVFEPVTQGEKTCVSACLAMLTGWKLDYVVSQFHKRYFEDREITTSDYLDEIGLPHHCCLATGHKTKPGHIYLAWTPSLNIKGCLHEVIFQVIDDDSWYFCDPNEGRGDRIVITVDEPENDMQFQALALVPEIEVNIEDLLTWREKNAVR